MPAVEMAQMSSPALAAASAAPQPIGVVPVGATEQHGPHLPVGMDTRLTEALVEAAGARLSDTLLVTPTIPIGRSDHHRRFAGTISVDESSAEGFVEACLRGLSDLGISRLALVSGHGGNFGLLHRIATKSRDSGSTVGAYDDVSRYLDAQRRGAREAGIEPLEADSHSGFLETSMALYLFDRSAIGDFTEVRGYTDAEQGYLERLNREGMRALSDSGVLGNPEGASSAAGRTILESIAADLSDWFTESFGAKREGGAASEA